MSPPEEEENEDRNNIHNSNHQVVLLADGENHNNNDNDPQPTTTQNHEEEEDTILHQQQHQIYNWPKVELHAHLNGCVRETTLLELARERGVTLSPTHYSTFLPQHATESPRLRRSLADCFQVFADIAKAVTCLKALRRITREALEDFAQHHVAYLELRTTPKRLLVCHDDNSSAAMATKREYLETVLEEMATFEQLEEQRYQAEFQAQQEEQERRTTIRLPLVVRLIVAVDRARGFAEAKENVQLAMDLVTAGSSSTRVVGLDVGGNPTVGNLASDILPLLQHARQTCPNLRVTIHCGEVPCEDNTGDDDTSSSSSVNNIRRKELEAIWAFQPDRLGHALLLPLDLKAQLLSKEKKRIPIETCPTSNVMTLELVEPSSSSSSSLLQNSSCSDEDPNKDKNDSSHHQQHLVHALRHEHPGLKEWLAADYPLAISTDDPGVFDTNATQEVVLLQQAFDLDAASLQQRIYTSLDYAFCDPATKDTIRKRWQSQGWPQEAQAQPPQAQEHAAAEPQQ